VPIYKDWNAVYDEEDLESQIRRLALSDLEGTFYELQSDDPAVFQGDVIDLEQGAPVIDENREAAVVGDYRFWLVIGNTCDLDRQISDVKWSQVVPIETPPDLRAQDVRNLRSYKAIRTFYLPPWPGDDVHRWANLVLPVSIHKEALRRCKRVARLSYAGWVLLHSCLVRFLARRDRRESPPSL